MGPDVPKMIDDTWKSECGTPNNAKCVDAITKIFEGDNNQLAVAASNAYLMARQIPPPAALGALAALFGAVVIAGFKMLEPVKPIPVHIHVPSIVLSSLSRASTASKFVFKIADNDANPVTAIVTG